MVDLFTRLVSGPASAVPLAPRVPAPFEHSNVDEVDPPSAPAFSPTWTQARALESTQARALEVPEPAPARRVEPVQVVIPLIEPKPPEKAPEQVAALDGPALDEGMPAAENLVMLRDLGAKVSSQRHKSSKISSELRPRESSNPPPHITSWPQAASQPQPQPERTTVRIEIGRIEIRAPQAPVVLPPARPQEVQGPQGLSLADYLRGSDGRPR